MRPLTASIQLPETELCKSWQWVKLARPDVARAELPATAFANSRQAQLFQQPAIVKDEICEDLKLVSANKVEALRKSAECDQRDLGSEASRLSLIHI